jgi:hypothetical protein
MMLNAQRTISGFLAGFDKKRRQIFRHLVTLAVLAGNDRLAFKFPNGQINDKFFPTGDAMIFISRHRNLLARKCKMVIS